MCTLSVDGIRLEVVVVTDTILLTSLTPTETEFQLIQPVGMLEDRLLADLPAECY